MLQLTDAVHGQPVRFAGRQFRVFDLSQHLSNRTAAFEPMAHRIDYLDHADTITHAQERFGLGADYWRDGLGWAMEHVQLTTHSGTHVDAPYHYAPTSAGRPAKRIDEVPLQWLMGDGVLLSHLDGDRTRGITATDVKAELERIDYELKPDDIVLVRTDMSKRYDEPGYDMQHVGLRADAVRYLTERGVRLIGIDAWGLDRALDVMVAEAKAGDRQQLWEAHYVGAETEYCQIEKLCNLDQLPAAHGFFVLALPVVIEGASGGWSRVVALWPED